jgi:hypothetical protein
LHSFITYFACKIPVKYAKTIFSFPSKEVWQIVLLIFAAEKWRFLKVTVSSENKILFCSYFLTTAVSSTQILVVSKATSLSFKLLLLICECWSNCWLNVELYYSNNSNPATIFPFPPLPCKM